MRIVFDGRCFFGKKSGVGFYALNILKNLLEIDPADRYTLFYGMALKPYRGLLPEFSEQNIDSILFRLPGRIFDFLIDRFPSVPIDALIKDYDVFHCPSFLPPPLKGETVITVHDMAHRLHPEFSTSSINRPLMRHLPRVVREAAKIIAVSENTKKDLVDALDVDPDKIVVIYEAADTSFKPIADETAIKAAKERYGINGEYIAFFGNIEPRKNLSRLIRSYVAAKQAAVFPHKLVIAGQQGWKYDDVFATAQELGTGGDIIFTGYIEDDDRPLLMNGARAVVYPSLYEGFGLPPLEAMACGTPVVTSNVASLPEVVGDAALMVDPLDEQALAKAIGDVLTDSALADRLIAAGLKRAKMFSWEKAARETLKVYEEVVANR